jgi:hypothetical protein
MNATVAELVNPETLTEKGIACIERYFNVVAKVFVHDWPDPGPAETTSSFGLTKFFAAMIRLLRQFIDEGATWQMVEAELQAIKKNVMALRKKAKYEVVLFLATDLKIPDATARISDVFRFLHANRTRPTSMTKVLKTV